MNVFTEEQVDWADWVWRDGDLTEGYPNGESGVVLQVSRTEYKGHEYCRRTTSWKTFEAVESTFEEGDLRLLKISTSIEGTKMSVVLGGSIHLSKYFKESVRAELVTQCLRKFLKARSGYSECECEGEG